MMHLYENGELKLQEKLKEGYFGRFSLIHQSVDVEDTDFKELQHTITSQVGNGSGSIEVVLDTIDGKPTNCEATVKGAPIKVGEDGWCPYTTVGTEYIESGMALQKQGIQVEGSVRKLTGLPQLSLTGSVDFLEAKPPTNITLTDEAGYLTLDCSARVTSNVLIGLGRKRGEEVVPPPEAVQIDELYAYLVMTPSKNFKVELGANTNKGWNLDFAYKQFGLSARGKQGELKNVGFNVEFNNE